MIDTGIFPHHIETVTIRSAIKAMCNLCRDQMPRASSPSAPGASYPWQTGDHLADNGSVFHCTARPLYALLIETQRALLVGMRTRVDAAQDRVAGWVENTFGEAAMAPHERAMRFYEEATELAQAAGLSADEVRKVIDVVYARPVGDPSQEIGGTRLTLLALAEALDVKAYSAEGAEIARLVERSKEEWLARQQAKADLGISMQIAPTT